MDIVLKTVVVSTCNIKYIKSYIFTYETQYLTLRKPGLTVIKLQNTTFVLVFEKRPIRTVYLLNNVF